MPGRKEIRIAMGLIEELKKIIKSDIAADEESRLKYSYDASLFEVKPEVIVFPKDCEDLKALVQFVSDKKKNGQKISISARSGGSCMSGGSLTESIIVDFTRYFNRIKNISNYSAVAEPGVYYRDFEKESLKQNLLLPSYPASKELCALGGMVSNNSGGEKTLTYGKTENFVVELKVILSDGNEYVVKPLEKYKLMKKMQENTFEGRIYSKTYDLINKNFDLLRAAKPDVSKNSAGYYLWNVWDGHTFDLTKLFVGSQGTLGLITEIKFRLVNPKKYSKTAVIFLKNLDPLLPVVKTVLEFKPESFESFDDNTLKLAIRFLPGLLKSLKTKNFFKLGWEFLPEFWMMLTGGFPRLVLLAEFTGDKEKEISRQIEGLPAKLRALGVKFRIINDADEAQKYWVIRRESFRLLREHIKGKRTAPFIDDFIVNVEKLPELLPRLQKVMSKYDLTYTIAGHMGDANFHIIPLMDFKDPKAREIIKNLADEVYDLVLSLKGSITAEHNDGLIRTPYLEKMYGPKVCKLFEETKKIFDPLDIFNPGKKVNGNLDYALKHLVTTS